MLDDLARALMQEGAIQSIHAGLPFEERLTRIGQLMVTPTGPDQFTFTHEVHGLTGSEPMAALGRGCPTYAGLPVDASSHWFDPARAGKAFSDLADLTVAAALEAVE